MKVITIIEAFSHAECIYSQVLFIKKAGYTVHFIGNIDLKERIKSFGFDSYLFFEEKEFKQLKTAYKIKNAIVRQNSKYVIFNTAQGNFVRLLSLLPFPKDIRFVGLMHNTKKLHSSFSQKIINRRIKKYFVLNQYITASQKKKLDNIQLQEFYPIYFPEFKVVNLPKQKNEIWITIPGAVEVHRKDYLGFLDIIKDKSCLADNIKFIFLGRCKMTEGKGKEVMEYVKKYNLEDKIQLFTNFINDDLFHSYLLNSDFIMPLIHPLQNNYTDFLESKISGSFNLGFAYKKPFLCYEDYREYEDFKFNALFYNSSNLLSLLKDISRNNFSYPREMYSNSKWNFNAQQSNYLGFLNNE